MCCCSSCSKCLILLQSQPWLGSGPGPSKEPSKDHCVDPNNIWHSTDWSYPFQGLLPSANDMRNSGIYNFYGSSECQTNDKNSTMSALKQK